MQILICIHAVLRCQYGFCRLCNSYSVRPEVLTDERFWLRSRPQGLFVSRYFGTDGLSSFVVLVMQA